MSRFCCRLARICVCHPVSTPTAADDVESVLQFKPGLKVKVAPWLLVLLSSLALFADDWSSNGHDPGGTKHSALTQINPQNVTRLQVTWTYRTGTSMCPRAAGVLPRSTVPLDVDNTLYVTSLDG